MAHIVLIVLHAAAATLGLVAGALIVRPGALAQERWRGLRLYLGSRRDGRVRGRGDRAGMAIARLGREVRVRRFDPCSISTWSGERSELGPSVDDGIAHSLVPLTLRDVCRPPSWGPGEVSGRYAAAMRASCPGGRRRASGGTARSDRTTGLTTWAERPATPPGPSCPSILTVRRPSCAGTH